MRNRGSLWLCSVVLWFACGGIPQARPPVDPDARLAESEHTVPQASQSVHDGEQKLAANDAEGAKALFEKALTEDPKDARAALDLGIALEMLGDAAGAEQAYRRA